MQKVTYASPRFGIINLMPGVTHVHYKGGQYRELHRCELELSVDHLLVVVYQHLWPSPDTTWQTRHGSYDNPIGKVWARPAHEFDGMVIVPGSTIPVRRFDPVSSLTSATCIIQHWAIALPLRHQGVLLAAVRGCDGVSKNANMKPLVRWVRWAFMNPADYREVGVPGAFFDNKLTMDQVLVFLKDWDEYPIHFVQHLMHAFEVIGYKHDNEQVRGLAIMAYYAMCDKLHVRPERINEMDDRLTEDRIAAKNVVQ